MEQDTMTIRHMAPRLTGETYNQAEALGSAVWLWMQSEFHRDYPLHALSALLLPAIAKGQFIIGTQSNKPIFYISWARFSEEAEARYLSQPLIEIRDEDWMCGDRTWLLDWIGPFGHTREMLRVTERLLHNHCVRWMYHKGDKDIIKEFWGISIPKEEAKYWFQTNPALTPHVMAEKQVITKKQ